MTAEAWVYATRGGTAQNHAGESFQYSEVPLHLSQQLVARVWMLGFTACLHEAGTWQIRAAWSEPRQFHETD